MKLYDASTDVVKQGGTRRGANMGILRVDHPDVLDFITCKDDLTQVTNFNISVAVTDKFMGALEAGASYDLLHPRTGKPVGQLDAREVFRKIVHGAWKTASRGCSSSTGQSLQPRSAAGRLRGDQPLRRAASAGVRRLQPGSINVGLFVTEAGKWIGTASPRRSTCARISSTTSSMRTSIR